jgi:hypothetical protein
VEESNPLTLERVSELFPPDLPRLLALQTYLRLQLAEVDSRIQSLERTQRGGQVSACGGERRSTAQGSSDDAGLRWWRYVQDKAGERGGTLHRGDCPVSGGALLSEAEARMIIKEGVRPCDRCAPQHRLQF